MTKFGIFLNSLIQLVSVTLKTILQSSLGLGQPHEKSISVFNITFVIIDNILNF